jgi:hypothetical protein
MKYLKDNYNVLSKLEAVQVLYDSVFTYALTIVLVFQSSFECLQKFNLDLCIVNIKFLVFSYFSSYYSLVAVLHIHTLHNLPEGTIINDSCNFVAIS